MANCPSSESRAYVPHEAAQRERGRAPVRRRLRSGVCKERSTVNTETMQSLRGEGAEGHPSLAAELSSPPGLPRPPASLGDSSWPDIWPHTHPGAAPSGQEAGVCTEGTPGTPLSPTTHPCLGGRQHLPARGELGVPFTRCGHVHGETSNVTAQSCGQARVLPP